MIAVVVWTIVALVSGAGVLLVASVATGERGADGDQDRDLRAGLAELRRSVTGLATLRRRPPEEAEALRAASEPVDVRLEEFLRVAAVEDDGYLQADELTDTLSRAREKAARSVPRIGRRSA
ncbi:hypothetical protein ACGIF2_04995 [Cellulomonas sp. P22]|uniref:hypothetical protein n=1 Tax=Cellulomonas sp. P22 TaxID=3373189 RepID=UPI00379A2762